MTEPPLTGGNTSDNDRLSDCGGLYGRNIFLNNYSVKHVWEHSGRLVEKQRAVSQFDTHTPGHNLHELIHVYQRRGEDGLEQHETWQLQ